MLLGRPISISWGVALLPRRAGMMGDLQSPTLIRQQLAFGPVLENLWRCLTDPARDRGCFTSKEGFFHQHLKGWIRLTGGNHPLPSTQRWCWVCDLSPFFYFWRRELLRFHGVFLKLCVTPCSSFPYPPFPNRTMPATLLKVMLFNQVHACLLMEEENIGLAKQG